MQIKQNEKFSYFGENQLYRKAVAYDNIVIMPYKQILQKCMQNSYLR